MSRKFIEASELPVDEKVYLRKDWAGYRIVHPVKVDGKLNWWNLLLGGKRNGLFLLIVLILLGVAYVGVADLISNYEEIADNPCNFCTESYIPGNRDYSILDDLFYSNGTAIIKIESSGGDT